MSKARRTVKNRVIKSIATDSVGILQHQEDLIRGVEHDHFDPLIRQMNAAILEKFQDAIAFTSDPELALAERKEEVFRLMCECAAVQEILKVCDGAKLKVESKSEAGDPLS